MNSGSEQVFVMKSNSEKGWLDKAGYSRDKPIKEEVINIIEGGIKAFKKKLELYDEVF
ncbi:MAG: hypothetical protein ACTIDE_09525 [Carnobacterium maltaromaticum]